MANELQRNLGVSGLYPYALIDNAAGQRWSTVAAAFVTYAAGDILNYDVPITERGTTGVYAADFPAGITAGGRYRVAYGVGLSEELPSIYDASAGEEFIDWNGSGVVSPVWADLRFGPGKATHDYTTGVSTFYTAAGTIAFTETTNSAGTTVTRAAA